jgi:hypothetical protein
MLSHPFWFLNLSQFWINWKNLKPLGPTHQPPCPNNGAARCWPCSDCSRHRSFVPQFHHCHRPDRIPLRLCQPPPPAIKGASLYRATLLPHPPPSPPLCHHTCYHWTITPVPLRTPWHCNDTVNSLDPLAGTLGYSSGRSPARTRRPSTSPLPASLVSLPSSPNPQRSPHHRGLLLDRWPHDHRPSVGFCRQATGATGGERSPALGLRPKGPCGLGHRGRAGQWPIGLSPFQQCPFTFSFGFNSKLNSNLVWTLEIKRGLNKFDKIIN